MKRTYLFIRHAEGIHQSPAFEPGAHVEGSDWPLTARGERQADALGAALARAEVGRLVSSTLLRARETARRASAHGIPYEHAWGELDEISPRALQARPRRAPEWLVGVIGAARMRSARGRARSVALTRVERRVRDVFARLDAMDEARVAIVSHGYWILLMALLVPGPARLRPIANCSITRVDVIDGRPRLASFALPPATLG